MAPLQSFPTNPHPPQTTMTKRENCDPRRKYEITFDNHLNTPILHTGHILTSHKPHTEPRETYMYIDQCNITNATINEIVAEPSI